MIDTNKLRKLTQKATPGPWKVLPVGDGRQKFAVADSEFLSILTVTDEGGGTFGTVYDDDDARFIAAANPAAISELLDRLEEAEKERDGVAQQLVQSEIGKRKAVVERDVLRDKLALESQESGALHEAVERACEERDALQAKIERMEQQEPVAWMSSRNGFICKENKNPDYNVPLKRLDLDAQGE